MNDEYKSVIENPQLAYLAERDAANRPGIIARLLTLEFFTRFLKSFIDSWFAREMVQSHLAILDPEPCPIPVSRSKRCNKPGSVLTLVELKSRHGTHRTMGVRKLCVEHSVTVACNKYWMRLAAIKANAEIKKAKRPGT